MQANKWVTYMEKCLLHHMIHKRQYILRNRNGSLHLYLISSLSKTLYLLSLQSRLDNRFYRRINAVQFDVRYIATNTEKFNQKGSNIVRQARIVTEVCLKLIKWVMLSCLAITLPLCIHILTTNPLMYCTVCSKVVKLISVCRLNKRYL